MKNDKCYGSWPLLDLQFELRNGENDVRELYVESSAMDESLSLLGEPEGKREDSDDDDVQQAEVFRGVVLLVDVEDVAVDLLHEMKSAQQTTREHVRLANQHLREVSSLPIDHNDKMTADDEEEDTDDDEQQQQDTHKSSRRDLLGFRGGSHDGVLANSYQQRLESLVSSTTLSVAEALIDSNFDDFTPLKTAYLNREEKVLVETIQELVRRNERLVESVCRESYSTFVQAGRLCATLRSDEAKVVEDQISTATKLATGLAKDLNTSVLSLGRHKQQEAKLSELEKLLNAMITCSETLELVESQVFNKQWAGAAASLRNLVQSTASISASSLSSYVLNNRLPALRQEIMSGAVQQLNVWLKSLRDDAPVLGECALYLAERASAATEISQRHSSSTMEIEWRGKEWRVVARSNSRGLSQVPRSSGPEDSILLITPSFAELSSKENPEKEFSAVSQRFSSLISSLCEGAWVQQLFKSLTEHATFAEYVTVSRRRQMELDLLSSLHDVSTSALPEYERLSKLQSYSMLLLGYVISEDLIYRTTKPQIRSPADFLVLWQQLVSVWTQRAHTLTTSSNSMLLLRAGRLAQAMCSGMKFFVQTVELDISGLVSISEVFTNRRHSALLQQCCADLNTIILVEEGLPVGDEGKPPSVSMYPLSMDVITRILDPISFPFHLLQSELPFNNNLVPFSTSIPRIIRSIESFMTAAQRHVDLRRNALAASPASLNNMDSLLFEYLTVAFRSVISLMAAKSQNIFACIPMQSVPEKDALRPAAIMWADALVLRYVLSYGEQLFVRSWSGTYAEEFQVFGQPSLLKDLLAPVNQLVQSCAKTVGDFLQKRVEGQLLPQLSSIAFWKQRRPKKGAEVSANTPTIPNDSGSTVTPPTTTILSDLNGLISIHLQTLAQFVHPQTLVSLSAPLLIKVCDIVPTALKGCIASDAVEPATVRSLVPLMQQYIDPLTQWPAELDRIVVIDNFRHRAPLDLPMLWSEINKQIDDKEVRHAEEAAILLVMKASKEAAGTVLGGVKDAGIATKNGFKWFGKEVKKTATKGAELVGAMSGGASTSTTAATAAASKPVGLPNPPIPSSTTK